MSHKRHRHFVALPLAVLTLVVVGIGTTSLRASVVPSEQMTEYRTSADSLTQDIAPETSFILEPESALRVRLESLSIDLLKGSFFLRSSPLAQVHILCDQLFLLRAQAYISLTDSSLTIFALRGSVFIIPCSAKPIFLAEGQQFRRSLATSDITFGSVPSSWVTQHTSSLSTLPFLDQTFSLSTIPSLLRPYAALKLLSLHSLSSADHGQILSLLRSIFDDDPSILRSLVAETANEHLQLSDEILAWWSQSVVNLASRDASSSLMVLREVSTLPAFFLRADYPVQRERWQKILLPLLTTVTPFLSSSDAASLPALRAAIFHDDRLSSATSSVSPSVRSLPLLSSQERSSLAYEFLSSGGFLLSAQTQVLPQDSVNRVHVLSVVRAEQGSDHLYEFDLDFDLKRVLSIHRDDALLPNSLPFEYFQIEKKTDHGE
jgi:hypothetical protein